MDVSKMERVLPVPETIDGKIVKTIQQMGYETFPLKSVIDLMRATDRRFIVLRQQNIQDMETLQEIIQIEENRVLSLDETLARVLAFYRRFVPYKEHEEK